MPFMVFGKSVFPKKIFFCISLYALCFAICCLTASPSFASCPKLNTLPRANEGALGYDTISKCIYLCTGTEWENQCSLDGSVTAPAATASTSGPAQCWGDASHGKNTIPAGLGNVKTLAVNNSFICAIKQDDTVQCWGASMSTVPYASIGTVKSITNPSGGLYACAIKTDDTLTCWAPWTGGLFVPPGSGTVKSVSVGASHYCAVKTDDTVRCWGDDTYGQTTVPATLGTVKSVAVTTRFSCAVETNGAITCWGDDTYGQISSKPGGTNHVSLIGTVTTADYMCSIKTDNTFKCFGYGGHLIDGIFTPSLPSNSVTKGLGLNNFNVCSIESDDTVKCWGDNSQDFNNIPAGLGAVKFITPINPITVCAIKADDTVQCWGGRYNSTWGTYDDDAGPVPASLGPVIALSRSQLNVCVIKKTSGGGGGGPTYTGTWNSTAWGACSATAPSWSIGAWSACASGTQTRTVTCPSNSGTQTRTNSCSTGNPADCDPATTPTTSQSCTNSSCSGMAPATSQSCCGIVSAPVITSSTSAGCGNSNVTFTATCSSGFVRRVDPSGAAVDEASPATYTTQIQNIINYTYKCTSNPTASPVCESGLESLPQVTSTPTAYSVTPATGAVSVKIYLSDSDANVQYSLIYIPTGAVIKTLVGTGNTMDFGAQFFPGTFAIRATRPAGCTNMMLNTVVRG